MYNNKRFHELQCPYMFVRYGKNLHYLLDTYRIGIKMICHKNFLFVSSKNGYVNSITQLLW